MKQPSHYSHFSKNQNGFVLFTALAFLLLLTLIGLSTADTAHLKLLITTNTHSDMNTMSRAEQTLRDAERLIVESSLMGINYYDQSSESRLINPYHHNWAENAHTTGTGGNRFIVEYLGCFTAQQQSVSRCANETTPPQVHSYRITARIEGQKGMLRIVQSNFNTVRRPNAPNGVTPNPDAPLDSSSGLRAHDDVTLPLGRHSWIDF